MADASASLALDRVLLPSPQAEEAGEASAGRAEAMVQAHFDFIWRLLRRLGVPPADVDDAAQYVFIVAAKRLSSIPEGHERPFLYGTASRVAWRMRRDSARRSRWIEPAMSDAVGVAPNPEQEFERREALALLDELLGGLADSLRETFVLSEVEGFTAPEISTMLDLPVGTVASRLRRARKEFSDKVRKLQAKQPRQS